MGWKCYELSRQATLLPPDLEPVIKTGVGVGGARGRAIQDTVTSPCFC